MNGVIFGRESARSEAEALISADVGSSHDTTPVKNTRSIYLYTTVRNE